MSLQSDDTLPVNEQERECLMSQEKLDRSSPDIWPELMPGIFDFASTVASPSSPRASTPPLALSTQDASLLYQFGALTPEELIEEVRKLQNVAYQLGVEEAKQMTRGRYLHVLAPPRKQGGQD